MKSILSIMLLCLTLNALTAQAILDIEGNAAIKGDLAVEAVRVEKNLLIGNDINLFDGVIRIATPGLSPTGSTLGFESPGGGVGIVYRMGDGTEDGPKTRFNTMVNRQGDFLINGTSKLGTNFEALSINDRGETEFQKKLTIVGSDFAERFNITDTKAIDSESLKGMLVVIDEYNPGQLTPCTIPYDKKVAGIVSGAGGVNTGMVMGEPNTLADGDVPVAMSGRVYCWADATYGAIEVGDLLTTSPTEGHAMKAKNSKKLQNAVVGKAMTSLGKGKKGLVLVLVNLQ